MAAETCLIACPQDDTDADTFAEFCLGKVSQKGQSVRLVTSLDPGPLNMVSAFSDALQQPQICADYLWDQRHTPATQEKLLDTADVEFTSQFFGAEDERTYFDRITNSVELCRKTQKIVLVASEVLEYITPMFGHEPNQALLVIREEEEGICILTAASFNEYQLFKEKKAATKPSLLSSLSKDTLSTLKRTIVSAAKNAVISTAAGGFSESALENLEFQISSEISRFAAKYEENTGQQLAKLSEELSKQQKAYEKLQGEMKLLMTDLKGQQQEARKALDSLAESLRANPGSGSSKEAQRLTKSVECYENINVVYLQQLEKIKPKEGKQEPLLLKEVREVGADGTYEMVVDNRKSYSIENADVEIESVKDKVRSFLANNLKFEAGETVTPIRIPLGMQGVFIICISQKAKRLSPGWELKREGGREPRPVQAAPPKQVALPKPSVEPIQKAPVEPIQKAPVEPIQKAPVEPIQIAPVEPILALLQKVSWSLAVTASLATKGSIPSAGDGKLAPPKPTFALPKLGRLKDDLNPGTSPAPAVPSGTSLVKSDVFPKTEETKMPIPIAAPKSGQQLGAAFLKPTFLKPTQTPGGEMPKASFSLPKPIIKQAVKYSVPVKPQNAAPKKDSTGEDSLTPEQKEKLQRLCEAVGSGMTPDVMRKIVQTLKEERSSKMTIGELLDEVLDRSH